MNRLAMTIGALAVYVNERNPIAALSLEKLK